MTCTETKRETAKAPTPAEVAQYEAALAAELLPAMGCTEPIALSYAASIAASRLGGFPDEITAEVSANIVKNVKSVVVPNTGGLTGIEAAVIAGFAANAPDAKLEVLARITPEVRDEIGRLVKTKRVNVVPTKEPDVFFIRVTGKKNGKTVSVTIRASHTNVTRIVEDGVTVFEKNDTPNIEPPAEAAWSLPRLIQAAKTMPLENVEPLLTRQLDCNRAIAEEGLRGKWGATIGRILLARNPEDPETVARAMAAAASDARMNGCELPVVIVSGSGNQGITASLPVFVFAEHLKAGREAMLRALLLSDLVTILLKQGIGKLSAYCGAVSAGAGSGAGIAMLSGMTDAQIESVVSNALAITSGMICDGAKSSCASKIAMSIEGALLAIDMVRNGRRFEAGEGIVQKSADETVRAVGRIASRGMVDTDRVIIDVMLGRKAS